MYTSNETPEEKNKLMKILNSQEQKMLEYENYMKLIFLTHKHIRKY